MSFTKSDRKLQSKMGKSFPGGGGHNGPRFAEAIALALKADFGASPSAVKRVARLTAANERTARNWFEGKNGPSGENLISLMHHSDAVLGVVLSLSNRAPLTIGGSLADIRQHLLDVVGKIDALQPTSD